jgi:uncharacterized repeat protein (TIGR03847 family)
MPDDYQHDLGSAQQLRVEAIGQPGQRRFRMLASGPGGVATIWIEKEQLLSLAVSIERLADIAAREYQPGNSREPIAGASSVLGTLAASLDFQSGNWSLGFDENSGTIEFQAFDVEENEDEVAKVRFSATIDQGRALSNEAMKVYSSGRPTCPLCNAPLNEGEPHNCPRSNGHARV